MIYRQGDVLIRRVDSIPTGAKLVKRDEGRIVLAYGEVTGHAHAIMDREAELLTVPDVDARFLRIMASSGVELRHEEHATIKLPAGNYEIVQQREYTPEAIVRVVD
jgi:hypothetical protein